MVVSAGEEKKTMLQPTEAVFSDAFKHELQNRFYLSEAFIRRFFVKRLRAGMVIDSWEDLADNNNPMSRAYVHFALSNVIRGRQARDLIVKNARITGKRSLDIGSAYGGMVIAFSEQGFDARGVEIDDYWCALGNVNCDGHGFGQPISKGDFLEAEYPEKFDVITCNDVIEHVERPRYALEKMTSMLDEEGVLYLVIPNARSWDHVVRDGHYGAFGMNLLDHYAAREYYDLKCKARYGKAYSCGEFHELNWYRKVLNNNGCRTVKITRNVRFPDRAEFEAACQKLRDARAAWDTKGLPEVLEDSIDDKFEDYLATMKLRYQAARTEIEMANFTSDYFEPFWTLMAGKSSDFGKSGPDEKPAQAPPRSPRVMDRVRAWFS
jgi:2-polyprenyl-3-methyl-5-hydroxy-6-metoxy-1,4-benzoquinol methylase